MKKNGLRVNRVGFATRGGCRLAEEDIRRVLDSGIDFLNWCGHPDALSRTIARLGPRRRDVTICVQFDARTALAAEAELHAILTELGTDYIDAITFYYVESRSEWEQIIGPSGAYEFCDKAKQHGKIRFIGLTTHQRWLAAETVQSGLLDLLMIRYNAAHRGAEKEVFPITDRLGIPRSRLYLPSLGGALEANSRRSTGIRRSQCAGMVSFRTGIAVGIGCSDGTE
ncbi:MAG: hypothetical protein KatS3mg105_2638 [Gemmatales bacterium]|nr:MAG: hypothetical protein KatS3mg105_2638 [Gemmatales bacterium]